MSLGQMGDDIAALLNHFKISKAGLAGHSSGGYVSIRAGAAAASQATGQ